MRERHGDRDFMTWRGSKMASEAGTSALITERNILMRRLEGVDRAKARIVEWYKVVVEKSKGGFRHETIEKQTLETVFRIFEEEVTK